MNSIIFQRKIDWNTSSISVQNIYSLDSLTNERSILSKTSNQKPELVLNLDTFPILAHLSISEVRVRNVWSASLSFISNIHPPGDFTFKRLVSDDFFYFFFISKCWNVSTSSGCRIFNCDHQLENILRNCWLFISNKASPLFRNPDDPSSEKAGYKDPTNYKVVTSSCNSILIRFRMFSTVSRPRHSSRRKES